MEQAERERTSITETTKPESSHFTPSWPSRAAWC